jgi:Uma2 family endonuclease
VLLKKQMESTEKNIKKMTNNNFASLDDGISYELINRELIKSPAPFIFHQRVNYKLTNILGNYIDNHDFGWIFEAPTDVILDDNNTVQPDILFISKESFFKIKENAIYGAHGIVIEIVSPSSLIADRYTKKDLYEKYGVKEYRLVDIANQSVEIFKLVNDIFNLFSHTIETGRLQSKIFPDMEKLIENKMPDFKIQ